MNDFAERTTAYRNIALLALSQATVGSNQAVIISSAALATAAFAPDPGLATLPVTVMIVGLALAAAPATRIVFHLGRRRAFILGAMLGIVGGLLAGLAVAQHSFVLFCGALAVAGASAAFVQQYRFAAADSVPGELKARAISFVMLGGVATGLLGPRLSYMAKDLLPGAEFAGSFLMMAVLSVLAIAALSFTRLAPIVRPEAGAPTGRSISQMLRSFELVVPMVTGMMSYSLMTLVMVATPLAMVRVCGHSTEEATTAIQWHIIAMFLPSLFTGSIIKRIGTHMTIGIGLVLITGCALINLNGTSVLHFDAALILLGVGWNFGFVGSTAMLASAYRPEEAQRAQALNEPLVFGSMAVASVSSGVLLQWIGWQSINVLVLPVATLGVILLAWGDLSARGRRSREA
jgi:predicted MFS family arabinose efflux permease